VKLLLIILVVALSSSCASKPGLQKLSESVEKSYDKRETISYSKFKSLSNDEFHNYMFVIGKGDEIPFDVKVSTESVEFKGSLPLVLRRNMYLIAAKELCSFEDFDYIVKNHEVCLPYVSFDKKIGLHFFL